MHLVTVRSFTRFGLAACAILIFVGLPRAANAWAIGSQINETGCHEPITAQALRNTRMAVATAPVLRPTRDEAALIDDVLFSPPGDLVPDLAGMTLLLGVRDNDLKGVDPLSSLDLIQVHGSPTTQEEHCIRAAADDGAAGDVSALAACRAFIIATATAALDGLDGHGVVDPSRRLPLKVFLAFVGEAEPQLPLFYLKMGAAMHALEDSFTHMYRTTDGMTVTVVLNWIDLVGTTPFDEPRDGPPHRAELDHCWDSDPILTRNYNLAIQAATELLTAGLDPSLAREQKIAQFGVVTAKYLGYRPGCTADNSWCDAPEGKVTGPVGGSLGCAAGGSGASWGALVLIAGVLLARRRASVAAAALVLAGALAAPARADTPAPPAGSPSAPAVPVVPDAPAAAPAAPVVASASTSAPLPAAEPGKEPGREVKTPTVAEVQAVRKDKVLGSKLGFATSFGVGVDRTAVAFNVGGRYRITEQWLVGVDGGWNPWITTSPIKGRAGVAVAYATLIRRFPMKFDRVNLRSSFHLGVSTLLFDVYGAPKYSTGPYVAISPLGIDYDLGGAVRLVIDPVEFAMPIPQLGQLPLYYEQFRFMVGLQIGS